MEDKRLIDANALNDAIKAQQENDRKINPIIASISYHNLNNIIDNAPTVELCYQTTSCLDCKNYDKENYYCPRFCEVIEEAIKSRPQGGWISVDEKLPDEMEKVLVWFEYYRYGDFNCMYQTYGFCYVCDGKWSPFINGETGWTDARIIAWCKLPVPYEVDMRGAKE